MPEWLLRNDNYEPGKDSQNFIDKSLLSLLKVLARLKINTEVKKTGFSINPVIKVFWMILQIILISLTQNLLYAACVGVSFLLLISLLELDEIKYIIRTVVTAVLFSVFILIPSMIMGNVYNGIMMVVKISITTTVVSIVAATTAWSELTGTFKRFFIPDVFIFVMDITIKYVVLLGELAIDMLQALKIRSVGRSIFKSSAVSAIIGTMFIKSKEMAEDMQSAMECRGFTGEYTVYRKARLKPVDFFFILYIVLSVLLNIYLR